MSTDSSSLNPLERWYARRILDRDLNLLALYHQEGRQFRMLTPLYWRASLMPLALGLLYFALRYSFPNLSQFDALLLLLSFLIGQAVAEFQIYRLNGALWEPMRALLDWRAIQGYRNDATVLEQPSPPLRITPEVRARLKLYQAMREKPPQRMGFMGANPDTLSLVLTFSLGAVGLAFLGPQNQFLVLSLVMFFVGQSLKRLKLAFDTALVWPEMQSLVRWDVVREVLARSAQAR